MHSTLITQIKQGARNQWAKILPELGGIDPALLDGRHHPCPKCGGKDRFRAFDDFVESGGIRCNKCFSTKNGDGIAALQWLTNRSFPEVVRDLAKNLGIPDSAPEKTKSERLAEGISRIGAVAPGLHDTLLAQYAAAKPPITPNGIRACGGSVGRWCGFPCIRLNGYTTIGDKTPSAVVLVRTDGKPFPATKKLSARKTHTLGGSSNSWITAGDIATADTILDVEGITDLMAAASRLPTGWAAVTNTSGAKARGKLSREFARGKRVIVVGDADEPGREGIARAVVAYHAAGVEDISIGQLPY